MTGAGTRFAVRLTPRGGADRVEGVDDGVLRARVAAAPADDAANRSLLRLIARELDVAPSAVRIVAGARARRKTVAVGGVDPGRVAERWRGLRVRPS